MILKIGHQWTKDPSAVRAVNDALLTAARGQGLALNGLTLRPTFLHYGPGIFKRGQTAAPHTHDELQLELVLKGRIAFRTARAKRTLNPGQGLVVEVGCVHEWKAHSDAVMLGVLVSATGAAAVEWHAWTQKKLNAALPEFGDAAITQITRQMTGIALTRPPGWTSALPRLADVWLWSALTQALDLTAWRERAPRVVAPKTDRARILFEKARAFLESNYMQPLKMKDVALQVGLSERHLTRLFRQFDGRTPGECLVDFRLAKAHACLEKEDAPLVKQVAFACGFRSASYFTYCFRKKFGAAPTG